MLSLTYLSSATALLDEHELAELLAHIRPKNDRLGLTGVLLYHGGNFIQTLEGPEDVVRSVFAAIEVDPRHRDVTVALEDEIDVRGFPQWSMGYRSISNTEADALLGPGGYLTRRRTETTDGPRPTRAEIFHRVFRDGIR